jgi:hypothetical protein
MHLIRQAPLFALLCCAAPIAGCGSDGGTDPTSPSKTPAIHPQLKPTRTQQEVTGSAFISLAEFGGAPERYSFSAVRHRDGSVSGRFELSSQRDGGTRVRGNVICFGIRASQGGYAANLGGIITQSSLPEIVGRNVIWTVFDGGEGAVAPPDEASDLSLSDQGTTEVFCSPEFALDVMPSEQGNIQVHP